MLKLSTPMKSTPENVVTEPLDKEKKGGVGSERQGEKSRGERKGKGWVGGGGGRLAASRVIYLPNQDTMSRL